MLSVPDQDLSKFLEKLTEEERNEMQEAFDHFHKSKEWNMICIIYEAGDCLDIVIRDEEDIYIAPIGKCAKLRESEKGAFNGHQETMDGQRKTCNCAAGLEGGMQRQ